MHHLRSLLVLGGILVCAFVPAARAVAESCSSAPSGGETVFSCVYGGEQSVTVPAGATGLHVVAVGGTGSGAGGRGAIVTADLAVDPGQTLYVEVGGGPGQNNGFNGGGQGGGPCCNSGFVGGGASDVRTCTVQPFQLQSCGGFTFGTSGADPRLVVAGAVAAWAARARAAVASGAAAVTPGCRRRRRPGPVATAGPPASTATAVAAAS